MVHVRIVSLSLDSVTKQPVVILRPVDDHSDAGRFIPIWIGHAEATAILFGLQEIAPPRPMTHDLLARIIAEMGATLTRVDIVRIEGGTFFANIVLDGGEGQEWEIDARPSDSIALAVRTGAPLFVSEQVLDEAAITAAPGITEEAADSEVERFREFLDHVDPSDFSS
ncbi:MAG: bifunctional nuclease family protein [Clostridiales bacterium]|nr:bifunctional nuclease family protein [Clostridiales bacterium]